MVRLSFERGSDGELSAALPPEIGQNETSPSDLNHSMVEKVRPVDKNLPEKLGVYRVIKWLGSGATGSVYLGHDDELDRAVALKWLHANHVDNGSIERFRREAKAMAAIDHSGVVDVYATGEHQGRPYMAMQFISGGDLQSELDSKGPRPVTPGLEDMRMAATGLQAAGRIGVIHRDVKPANLLREEMTGYIRVADFGLSREQSVDSSLTASGLILGTPYYVAPEIVEEGKGDHRSDIYSLGASFFYLLTGRPPFEGKTIAATLFQHVSQPIPLAHERRPAVSKSASAMLSRCLAKNPEERYQTYADLIADLDLLIEGKTLPELERAGSAPKLKITLEKPAAAESISVRPRPSSERRMVIRPAPKISKERKSASFPRRFCAAGIDFSILVILPLALSLMAKDQRYVLGLNHDMALILGAFLPFAALSLLFEFCGNSPGKQLLDLRVQGSDHKPRTFFKSLMRFCLTRPLYFVPLSWFVLADMSHDPVALSLVLIPLTVFVFFDFFSAVHSSGGSLHDWASGTRVVKESAFEASKRRPSLIVSYLLWLPPLGLLGMHRLYLERTVSGLLWFLTGGLFGIGWLLDVFSIPFMVFSTKEKRR
jgi:serine/threonine protein kinase